LQNFEKNKKKAENIYFLSLFKKIKNFVKKIGKKELLENIGNKKREILKYSP